jgi:hypothetical protein
MKIIIAVSIVAWPLLATAPKASASEWGCTILLCAASSNPSWHGVAECRPPMQRLISAMRRSGFSWPTCPEGRTGKPGYELIALPDGRQQAIAAGMATTAIAVNCRDACGKATTAADPVPVGSRKAGTIQSAAFGAKDASGRTAWRVLYATSHISSKCLTNRPVARRDSILISTFGVAQMRSRSPRRRRFSGAFWSSPHLR